MWYQLTRPFAFQSIQNRDLRFMRTVVPFIATVLLLALYLLLPVKPSILGDKKYLDYLLQIVGILPGFYIAALAAAATFNNPALDEPMPGRDAPHIDIQRGGETFSVTMTMRVFICHLFSYLSALSFMTAIFTLMIIECAPSLEYLERGAAALTPASIALIIVRYGTVFAVTFYFARIILITLHGLYFLIERMHQANR